MKTITIDDIQVLNSTDVEKKLNLKKTKINEFIKKGTFVGVIHKGKLFITIKSVCKFLGISFQSNSEDDENGWNGLNSELEISIKEFKNGERGRRLEDILSERQ
jgi:hypothetical protein